MKLLIRGGSIAAGHGVIKSYADILTESLLKRGNQPPRSKLPRYARNVVISQQAAENQHASRLSGIEVLNRSRYGETSFDGIRTFYDDIDCLKPEILLFHFGVDDAFQYVYRSEFQENLVQMIRLARTRFNPMIFLATAHAFDDPYEMDAVHIFYRSLRIVASDLDCTYIPIHHHWAGYLQEYKLHSRDLVQSDSRYPNETGHQVIAEAMIQWLGKIAGKSGGNNNSCPFGS